LWVDFDTDVEALRRLFLEIVQASPRWDRAAAGLQVTDASESGMQIRCLVSAADAGTLWDLRCEVREALFTRLRAAPSGPSGACTTWTGKRPPNRPSHPSQSSSRPPRPSRRARRRSNRARSSSPASTDATRAQRPAYSTWAYVPRRTLYARYQPT
jgi:hypothetical protein